MLVGRLTPTAACVYESVNACIRFVGSLDGCHVVTVEALARGGALHPVQAALVEHHGSQCGFCTPGFVMSLYALWMHKPDASVPQIEKALQGNLCRCTGYAPIIRAAQAAAAADPAGDVLVAERERVTAALRAMRDGARVTLGTGRDALILPADVADLAALRAEHPEATIVAGATDVGLWVTKFLRPIGPVIFIGHLDALRTIDETEAGVTLGAGVSYTEAYGVIARRWPQLVELWDRIGGEQVRNMGTVGGNIANGSPIGDTPPALIALGARLRLRGPDGPREMALEDFFVDYGKQDRQPDGIRGERLRPRPARRRGARRLQGDQAARRGHHRHARRVPAGPRRRPGDRRAPRLRRHGGDAEARGRGRGGAARPALDRRDGPRGDGGARDRLHAADRLARLGRLPACASRRT